MEHEELRELKEFLEMLETPDQKASLEIRDLKVNKEHKV